MLANLVQILNLTPVFGGSLEGKSDPGLRVFKSLETESTNMSESSWPIERMSGVRQLYS